MTPPTNPIPEPTPTEPKPSNGPGPSPIFVVGGRPRGADGEVLRPLRRGNRFPLGTPAEAGDAKSNRQRRQWPLPARQREKEVFRASRLALLRRLLVWLTAIAHYAALRGADRWHGRDNATNRGISMRETLAYMGGTFVKLGQQLSTRIDLFPYETCFELSKLLDDMPAFPIEQATKTVEAAIGRPLHTVFRRFDPKPLGSMSIGCVYRAELIDGEEVVVKVRRPGIGELFAADLAALDLLCRAAESLTVFRSGFTRALRTELATMLLEELDFRGEARFQELFRRQAKRDRQEVSAPRVFHEYSNHEVMVTEYVKGIWLQDLIGAVGRADEDALSYLATLKIEPRAVARRLLHTFYWSTFETLFYHADPHPGNILILPDSRLVFTNFGACGPTTYRNRRNYGELFRRQASRDIDGMVQVFGNILSPLPQIDLHAFTRAAEAAVARWQYGFDSKHSEWWERTSAGLWMGILTLTRDFHIPVNIETVRFFRSTLLYEGAAARVDGRIDAPREYRRYLRLSLRRQRRRSAKRWTRELEPGQLLVEFDRISDLAARLIYRLQDLSDQPATSFLASLNKSSFVISSLLHLGVAVSVVTSLGMAGAALFGEAGSFAQALRSVVAQPGYAAVVLLLAMRSYRVIQYRLSDMDRQE